MKRTFAFLILMAVTSAISIILFDYFKSDAELPEGVIQTKLYSNLLIQERELIIHLPVNYDSAKEYPVMYVLDGSSQDGHIADKVHTLSAAGCAPEVIVVGVLNMTAENRQSQLMPPYMHIDADKIDSPMGDGDRFLSFIESELIPFIESNYSASHVRLFSGHSRGGLLVMHSLLSKPDLFQARFCFSAPFWRHDNVIVSKVEEFLASNDTLRTFIYMSAGERETNNIKDGLGNMMKVLKEKAPTGFVWYADYIGDADHQNNAQRSAARAIKLWSDFDNKR